MNKISSEIFNKFLKNYGFILPNSEIYGGMANSWDYGPVGVLIKNNLQNIWWKYFVTLDSKVYGMDTNIFLNSKVWKASGHLDNFSDLLIDCKSCKKRFRADHFLAEFGYQNVENKQASEIDEIIEKDEKIKCLNCNKRDFTKARKFNLMFEIPNGIVSSESSDDKIYLRPETAQALFINFKSVVRTMRLKLPFALAQVGRSFRNEITIGNSIFRTREFEQMELEWFCKEEETTLIFKKQLEKILTFLKDCLKINEEKIRLNEISKDDLAHYSKRTVDIEFDYAHGWAELWGLADRGAFDLTQHMNHSKEDLTYFDETTKERFIPHVVEPSVGLNRLMYALMYDAYKIELLENGEEREVLKLATYLAPYIACVCPLTNKQLEISQIMFEDLVQNGFNVNFEKSGSIGKRYRRNDAIGVPYTITCDFDTFNPNDELNVNELDLNNLTITVRDRDSLKQWRLSYSDLKQFLLKESNYLLKK